MNDKNKFLIIVIAVVLIVGTIGTYKLVTKDNKPKVNMPRYSIEKIGSENCKLSYEKLCFNIPDDYKCVGNNKCQLSNDKDMLLIQVFLNENYKDNLEKFVSSGKNGYIKLENQEEKELNGTKWIIGNNKYKTERYYYTKAGNDVYTVKILSLRDSGGKFDELTMVLEDSIKVSK